MAPRCQMTWLCILLAFNPAPAVGISNLRSWEAARAMEAARAQGSRTWKAATKAAGQVGALLKEVRQGHLPGITHHPPDPLAHQDSATEQPSGASQLMEGIAHLAPTEPAHQVAAGPPRSSQQQYSLRRHEPIGSSVMESAPPPPPHPPPPLAAAEGVPWPLLLLTTHLLCVLCGYFLGRLDQQGTARRNAGRQACQLQVPPAAALAPATEELSSAATAQLKAVQDSTTTITAATTTTTAIITDDVSASGQHHPPEIEGEGGRTHAGSMAADLAPHGAPASPSGAAPHVPLQRALSDSVSEVHGVAALRLYRPSSPGDAVSISHVQGTPAVPRGSKSTCSATGPLAISPGAVEQAAPSAAAGACSAAPARASNQSEVEALPCHGSQGHEEEVQSIAGSVRPSADLSWTAASSNTGPSMACTPLGRSHARQAAEGSLVLQQAIQQGVQEVAAEQASLALDPSQHAAAGAVAVVQQASGLVVNSSTNNGSYRLYLEVPASGMEGITKVVATVMQPVSQLALGVHGCATALHHLTGHVAEGVVVLRDVRGGLDRLLTWQLRTSRQHLCARCVQVGCVVMAGSLVWASLKHGRLATLRVACYGVPAAAASSSGNMWQRMARGALRTFTNPFGAMGRSASFVACLAGNLGLQASASYALYLSLPVLYSMTGRLAHSWQVDIPLVLGVLGGACSATVVACLGGCWTVWLLMWWLWCGCAWFMCIATPRHTAVTCALVVSLALVLPALMGHAPYWPLVTHFHVLTSSWACSLLPLATQHMIGCP